MVFLATGFFVTGFFFTGVFLTALGAVATDLALAANCRF